MTNNRRIGSIAACAAIAMSLLGAPIGASASESSKTAPAAHLRGTNIDRIARLVRAFGASRGPEGCKFLSRNLIDELGGWYGCQYEFRNSPSVRFEVLSVRVSPRKIHGHWRGSAEVRNRGSGRTVKYAMILEFRHWKINGLL
jgi:hypothetical protein